MQLVLVLLADHRQSGGRVWRLKPQRSMRTVLVVMPDIDPKGHCCIWPEGVVGG